MKLYDSNGNYLIDTDDKESFNHGTYGKLYMYNDDTCLKVFNNPGFHSPKQGAVMLLQHKRSQPCHQVPIP